MTVSRNISIAMDIADEIVLSHLLLLSPGTDSRGRGRCRRVCSLYKLIGVTSEFNDFKRFGHTATFNNTLLLLRICFGILAPRQRQGKQGEEG